jgi:hypothetical protein
VLPSKQKEVKIEIAFLPRIAFHANEIVISVEGDFSSRPRILERTDHYVQSGAKPSTAKDHSAGHAFHAYVDRDYNLKTERVIGLKIKTKKTGLYPLRLDFIMKETTGTFLGLEILVENTPSTQMICHAEGHGSNCLVSPEPIELSPAEIAERNKILSLANDPRHRRVAEATQRHPTAIAASILLAGLGLLALAKCLGP